ncbi:MAG: malate dehydrogenase [Candidatus Melainabacteria bacterium]|nr:malate dehydrogenase [Candidatus Melainabacteria bacterium]MBI3308443.1 malate dehydrogenase [Candidatus Melainabacteria bacterium]
MGLSVPKVTIIGAGNVGATCAQKVIEKNIANVVLLDRNVGTAKGKALDLIESSPVELHSRTILGTDSYEDTKDSDIVVITAGLPRKQGQSRDDLLKANGEIVSSVTQEAVKYSPNCMIIVVSNPVDVMTHLSWLKSKLPENKVMGMAGVLDSSRMRYFIAAELNVSVEDVQAMVLGGHGDQMVPLPRYSTVSGIPVLELIPPSRILEINDRTRKGGGEIIEHLGTSSYYGAASSIADMVEAIVQDKKRIVPACAHLSGQYGINDIFIGVPVKLGQGGIEDIIELSLAPEELDALRNSAALVKENVGKLTELQLI